MIISWIQLINFWVETILKDTFIIGEEARIEKDSFRNVLNDLQEGLLIQTSNDLDKNASLTTNTFFNREFEKHFRWFNETKIEMLSFSSANQNMLDENPTVELDTLLHQNIQTLLHEGKTVIRDREIKVGEKYFRFSSKHVNWDGN